MCGTSSSRLALAFRFDSLLSPPKPATAYALTLNTTMSKKIIIINGDNFSDIETFYDEIDNVLTKNLDWKTGHNLNAFNDLLCGGFGVFEYDETVKIIWNNFSKSKQALGQEMTDTLLRIIKEHGHIEFTKVD